MSRFATIAFLAAVALSLLVASLSHRQALALRRESPEIDAHVAVPAPGLARVLALGENELLADLSWVRTLVYYGDGLVHDTGMPDVEKLVELINRLDPRFRRPYAWGAYATTFRKRVATQEEYHASVDILRRAVAQFPTDWELHWLLGLRLYFDIKDNGSKDEGAMYIERAMRLPGSPPDLPMLAASLRTRLGQKERALRELREMILTLEDPKARKPLEARYAALASEAASSDLVQDAEKLDKEWKANLPYTPRTMHILVGPPPPVGFDLGNLAGGESTFAP
jgi:hypothetical protein